MIKNSIIMFPDFSKDSNEKVCYQQNVTFVQAVYKQGAEAEDLDVQIISKPLPYKKFSMLKQNKNCCWDFITVFKFAREFLKNIFVLLPKLTLRTFLSISIEMVLNFMLELDRIYEYQCKNVQSAMQSNGNDGNGIGLVVFMAPGDDFINHKTTGDQGDQGGR